MDWKSGVTDFQGVSIHMSSVVCFRCLPFTLIRQKKEINVYLYMLWNIFDIYEILHTGISGTRWDISNFLRLENQIMIYYGFPEQICTCINSYLASEGPNIHNTETLISPPSAYSNSY